MEVSTSNLVTGVSYLLSSGLIGWAWKASVRLEVLESLFAEKKTTIDSVKLAQDSMDKRLIMVESAVAGLNEVIPELRKVGNIATQFELLLRLRGDKLFGSEDSNEQENKK